MHNLSSLLRRASSYVSCALLSLRPLTSTDEHSRTDFPSLDDDGHMVVHIFRDIPQEARRNDAHSTERNADVVHILVALRVGNLACLDDRVECDIALQAGDQAEGFGQRLACEADCLSDEGGVGDV